MDPGEHAPDPRTQTQDGNDDDDDADDHHRHNSSFAAANPTFFGQTTIAKTVTQQSPEHTLIQQYRESEKEAKKECERLKLANGVLMKKLSKCQKLLHVNEMFSAHDKIKIENLEQEKAQLGELNRMLKGSSDDANTNDLDAGELSTTWVV